MSKKILLAIVLLLSHSAVAVLTFGFTRSWLQQTNNTQPRRANDAANTLSSIESKLERFIKDMSPYVGGRESAIRGEMLFTLRVFEELEDSDRMLIFGLQPDDVANHHLAVLLCVRDFLNSYSQAQNINVLAFTSEQYRSLLINLAGDANPTPERAIMTKKRIWQLANSFLALRKTALTLPYTQIDDRLHFLEMMRDLASENYADVKIMAEPVLPLFNDREGRLLYLVEKWLNSSHARKALPIEQLERLYQEGKIQVNSPAFGSYLTRIKGRVNDEHVKSIDCQGLAREQLTPVYAAVETFFISLAQLSAP